MNVLEGKRVAKENVRIGIVCARFNEFITSKLLGGAMDGLIRHGVKDENVDVAWVPGAFEIPVVAKRMAEADGTKAQLIAQAEGEQALADARASHDKVNFELAKVEIENRTKVEIATNVATIMAEVGKNAQFVNIGGSVGNGSTGNVLLDTLRGIPELMKVLDVENQALNGKPFNEEVEGLVKSVVGPVKGILSSNTPEATDNK